MDWEAMAKVGVEWLKKPENQKKLKKGVKKFGEILIDLFTDDDEDENAKKAKEEITDDNS
jgi:hypothetical protein